jgi:hypothetical protein
MSMHTLRVFEADPNESGLGAFAEVNFRSNPARALKRVARTLRRVDGYAPGDRIWGLWDDDNTGRCRSVTHTLSRVRP